MANSLAGLDPSSLDRRVTIYTLANADDGFSTDRGAPEEIGKRWMRRELASDGEMLRASALGAVITARFTARYDSLTSRISAQCQLECGGIFYEVTGLKEIGRRVGLEITTKAIIG